MRWGASQAKFTPFGAVALIVACTVGCDASRRIASPTVIQIKLLQSCMGHVQPLRVG